ncbi:MAG TPA: hypothetical protein VGP26_08905 [Actinophytocola sp.]|nr:hypothetical protein [Actinophytocola sp.]
MAMAVNGHDVTTTVNMTVGRDVDVRFLVSQENPDSITLVIGDSAAEISFDPSTVEALHERSGAAVHELYAGGPPA